MQSRIEDYALIGDCETAALVSRNGSIDWLCWPRFDSGAVFAALVGNVDNGHWLVAPTDVNAATTRRYRDSTLILDTEFRTESGTVCVTDFMPVRSDASSRIVRIVRGLTGSVAMRMQIAFRFDYGSIVPWVTRLDEPTPTIKAIAGPDMAILRSSVALEASDRTHHSKFTVNEGDTVTFVLAHAHSFHDVPAAINPIEALEKTEAGWHTWSGRYKKNGPYTPQVMRSLITLKALTYRPTGSIVAAPTTSLPELIGGSRNWDYRYCWLRDTTFTLLALLNSGFVQEAVDWHRWLRHALAGDPARVQIMYGLGGERRLDEWTVNWLEGYRQSKPVRIGNGAASQVQLDIYGEVMDTFYHSTAMGLDSQCAGWDLQCALVEHLETTWQEPDEGIWEVRGGRRHFTHSKVMAWVAFDRAVKSIEQFGVPGPLERWRASRDEIHASVCANGFNTERGSFIQSYDSTALDASALLIPLVGFLPADDQRITGTIAAIERELIFDGLVHRYDTRVSRDGLPSGEGAFLACSFWYADNLILAGRIKEATTLFEHLLMLCNDVGLLSEEYDPSGRRMLGNFPQAFSHVALINTAHNLVKHDKPAEQRSGNKQSTSA